MASLLDKDEKLQQLELENNRLRQLLQEKETQLLAIEEELLNSSEIKKNCERRIVEASKGIQSKNKKIDELNKKNLELNSEIKAILEKSEAEIKKLENKIEELNLILSKSESEKKDLNEKYELNLKNHLEQTTMCSTLQDRIDELERELKDVKLERDKFSNELNNHKVVDASSISDLLFSTQMKIEKAQSDFILLEKKYEMVLHENTLLKEEYEDMRTNYDKYVRYDTHNQGLYRQLLSKLLDAETRLVQLTTEKSLNSSESSMDTVIQTDTNLDSTDYLVKENENLVALLSLLSGMNSIPFMGLGNILQWLESERTRLLSSLHDERCKRRNVEEQLISIRYDYKNLEIDRDRLDNPLECRDCCLSMRNETDIIVVIEALMEKCSHLSTFRDQIKRLEKEKKEIAQSLQEVTSFSVGMEDQIKAMHDETQYKDVLVNELKLEIDHLKEQLHVECEKKKLFAFQVKELRDNNKEVEEIKRESKEKDRIINDLKTQLTLTDIGNNITMSEEVTYLKSNLEKQKQVKRGLVQNIHSLGDLFSEFKINDFSDTINKRILQINKISEVEYTNGLMDLINDCNLQLCDTLNTYLHSYDNKYLSLSEGNLKVQEEMQQVYQARIIDLETRIAHYESDSKDMGTVESMYATVTTNDEVTVSASYLQRLQRANEVYLNQINELSTCLYNALDRTFIPSMKSTIISSEYDSSLIRYKLDQERADKVLWKSRAEQLEVLYANVVNNCSCLTDYELSILSSVIDKLYVYIVESVNIDYELGISLDFFSDEYNMQVRQQEEREPLIMETQLYVIQRVISTFIAYVNEKVDSLLLECESEREKRFYLERDMNRYQ